MTNAHAQTSTIHTSAVDIVDIRDIHAIMDIHYSLCASSLSASRRACASARAWARVVGWLCS